MQNDKSVYAVITVFALLVLAGFYLTFDKISALQTAVKNTELALTMKNTGAETVPEAPKEEKPPETVPTSTLSDSVADAPILSSILFTAESGSALLPQVPITITIESATRRSDNTVRFAVKAFTAAASSYTALDVGSLIQLIDADGNKTRSAEITGSFSSMPPKSSVSGSMLFSIPADRNTVILQVGPDDTAKYYEFDFGKKLYRETILG
jgi:hypothetical protein